MTRFEEDEPTILEILEEEDPFRVLIWGYALIEDALDGAIDGAFRDGTPDELKRLRLSARLALAQALELMPPDVAAAITALAKVRNRLAHGWDDTVTPEEVKSLSRVVAPFLKEGRSLEDYSEDARVGIAVGVTWQVTVETVDSALFRRAEERAALAAAWRDRHVLSAEQVAELLENELANVPEIHEDIKES